MTIPFQNLSFPEIYEQALVQPLFRPFAEPAVAAARLQPGDRVLDIACGTGIVARLARERVGPAGQVVGVDTSAPMLGVARKVLPDAEFREGDAGALPLGPEEQFDAAICHQGFQFFPDRPKALLEMRRALRPGGRLVLSTWRPDRELPTLLALRRIAEVHVGPVDDRRHAFGEPGPIEALLRDAGFQDIQSETVSRTVRFEDGSVFARLNAMALVSMSARGRELGESERTQLVDAIVKDSRDLVRQESDAKGFRYELRSCMTGAARV